MMAFGILFGNHRNLRSHLIECREDHFLRRPVGFGNRRAVVFEFCLCSLLMDFHDPGSCLTGSSFQMRNPFLPD